MKDVIVSVDGKAVTSTKEVVEAIGKAKPGDKVSLAILRDGQEVKVEVTIGTKPTPVAPKGPAWPGLKELEGISPSELSGHFRDWIANFTDKDGKSHTLKATPGVVSAVATSSITITPNGETKTVTFNVTGDTKIRKGRTEVKLTDIKVGDKVVVTTVDNSSDARLIQIGDAGILTPMPNLGRGWGPRLPFGGGFGPWKHKAGGAMPPGQSS